MADKMTAEEIVKLLKHCATVKDGCKNCSFNINDCTCINNLHMAAHDCIQTLQSKIKELESEKNRI